MGAKCGWEAYGEDQITHKRNLEDFSCGPLGIDDIHHYESFFPVEYLQTWRLGIGILLREGLYRHK
jgi:hypothetical protein